MENNNLFIKNSNMLVELKKDADALFNVGWNVILTIHKNNGEIIELFRTRNNNNCGGEDMTFKSSLNGLCDVEGQLIKLFYTIEDNGTTEYYINTKDIRNIKLMIDKNVHLN